MDEEIGVVVKLVDIFEEIEDWLYYDFLLDLLCCMGGLYFGQCQKWYVLCFKGFDSDVWLDKYKFEFDVWRWVRLDEILVLIVLFKWLVYEEVVM